ncbi:calmodulin-regulated spectrin-associated protein 3-like [Choloepus didactylus]|uniref:calmodulin-regulated spectrin-associated protein 3-like n=1 Tax=Choloepus didactylus TaxID=27675 RepID=UPI0018A0FC1B|nr:calmodulin-regulated spectrin-associated protein 3-like [Choloepus didactylus]
MCQESRGGAAQPLAWPAEGAGHAGREVTLPAGGTRSFLLVPAEPGKPPVEHGEGKGSASPWHLHIPTLVPPRRPPSTSASWPGPSPGRLRTRHWAGFAQGVHCRTTPRTPPDVQTPRVVGTSRPRIELLAGIRLRAPHPDPPPQVGPALGPGGSAPPALSPPAPRALSSEDVSC